MNVHVHSMALVLDKWQEKVIVLAEVGFKCSIIHSLSGICIAPEYDFTLFVCEHNHFQ
jgi:hypothetical protein